MRSKFTYSYLALLIGIASVCLIEKQSFAEPRAQNMEFQSEIFQTPIYNSMVLDGDRLYAATGYGLDVLDVSDPDHPELLGRTKTYAYTRHLAVKDSIVYLTNYGDMTYVIDASDPANLEILSERASENSVYKLYVSGNRLYELVLSEGVRISDISNPREPVLRSTFRRGQLPTAMAIKDSVFYIADYWGEAIIVANLSNLGRSVFYTNISIPQSIIRSITISDTLMFVSANDGGVLIYGISNPIAPNLLSDISSNGSSNGACAIGNALYVADGSGHLRVFDITDPTDPIETFTYTDYPEEIFQLGNRIVALEFDLWYQFALDEPFHPHPIYESELSNLVYRFAVMDRTAYVRRNRGIAIVGFDDPTNPQIVGSIDSLYFSSLIATEDGWLYTTDVQLSDTSAYLRAWDISNPNQPQPNGSADIGLSGGDFALGDNILARCNYTGQIELWDISSRGFPQLLSQINDAQGVEISIENDRLYMYSDEDEFLMYDISDPERPAILGRLPGLAYPNGITSHGNKVYIAEGNDGIVTLDVTNPAEIIRRGSISAQAWSTDITYSDSLLFLSVEEYGLKTYNPFLAATPRLHGFIETPGLVEESSLSDGIIVIADYCDLTFARMVAPGSVSDQHNRPSAFRLIESFPKPTNGSLKTMINLPTAATGEVNVFSSDGRIVFTSKIQTESGRTALTFDLSAFPSGSYNLILDARAPNNSRRYLQKEHISLIK